MRYNRGAGDRTVTVTRFNTAGDATDVTVITTWPAFIPVTTPVLETVASDAFEDCHRTRLSTAAGGKTVAVTVTRFAMPYITVSAGVLTTILVGITGTDAGANAFIICVTVR